MSSRALRKAQRELEEKQQLEKLSHPESDESDDEPIVAPSNKASMFAMLGEDDDNEEKDSDEGEKGSDEEPVVEAPAPQQRTTKAAKRKKKKNKRGKEPVPQKKTKDSSNSQQLDEIDRALLALSLSSHSGGDGASDTLSETISPELQELFSILSVDTQHLHAANEMRRLFGRAALEGHDDTEAAGGRRRGRGAQQVGLAGAVRGNVQSGRNLAAIGRRRNIFIQGKEEWPGATSGGLGMEVVEKRKDGTVEYRFVHNMAYQDVQKQFETCVASMDPNRMIQLLRNNPYHISTLLQVSEIAKQERDHTTSGDLLERALFSFGRSIHSTFSRNLSEGKARLSFRRPENREFWLAGWRYISNLGMRSTWRTAFEWSKLLLSIDPEGDPYCIRLVIDRFALRARQPKQLIDMVSSDYLQDLWSIPPNLATSVGLAYSQHNRPDLARSKLRSAFQQYPWIASRLCRELEINPIPKPVWGKEPEGDYETLLCELYVTKAKDLWNTPEATSLLVEVASTCDWSDYQTRDKVIFDEVQVARHVILTDTPALIGLLSRRLTARYTSTSDPLPPTDNLPSYDLSDSRSHANSNMENTATILHEYVNLQTFFRNLIPWLFEGETAINPETGAPPTTADVERAIRESGVAPEIIAQRTTRLEQLRQYLRDIEFDPNMDEDDEHRFALTEDEESDEH
ncbi:DUF654-domain-containing protein [Mytilinidion resinicola]|uniref:DUF654-domain-containing protein n=1 Tax=Mytilinidion resinicola TaxID=574789 RepID=A0A6A6YMT6_9PEZI|nr:DUF654-domain-containing protein [Mytilinidion resinicola]KAF2809285.1 DUF654-domain-containing protein [Mytilinidion resinicola]